jgi:hypothetical protein
MQKHFTLIWGIFENDAAPQKTNKNRTNTVLPPSFRQVWRKNFDLLFEKWSPLVFLLCGAVCSPYTSRFPLSLPDNEVGQCNCRFSILNHVPSPFLTVEEAAHYLRSKKRTLDDMRWIGTGPSFCERGGRASVMKGTNSPLGPLTTAPDSYQNVMRLNRQSERSSSVACTLTLRRYPKILNSPNGDQHNDHTQTLMD